MLSALGGVVVLVGAIVSLVYGVGFLTRARMDTHIMATVKTVTKDKEKTGDGKRDGPSFYTAVVEYAEEGADDRREASLRLVEQPGVAPHAVGAGLWVGHHPDRPNVVVLPPAKDEKLLARGWSLVTLGIVGLLLALGVLIYVIVRIRKGRTERYEHWS